MSESGLYINNVDTLAFAEEFKVGDVNHKDAYIEEVYSSEGCWTAVSECLQLVGGLGYMKDYPFERYLRDSRIMMIFEGTNEILRMFIALVGIHHANNELQELVAKFRNPLLYPNIAIAKVLERRQHVNDNPKLKLGLDGYLHPSLQLASKLLEYCVLRLQYGVEIAVSHYGTKIVEKQMFLKRLADVVIDIYAMTAVLGRASRSYCIGLQDSEEEMLLATTICQEAHARVKKNIREIEQGSLKNMDENLKEIALHIYKNQGYFPQHPLARND